MFIETGKEMQVKGLEGELTGVVENPLDISTNPKEKQKRYDDCEDENVFIGLHDVAKMNEGNLKITNNELSLQENEMMEKMKVRGDIIRKKVLEHAERQIEVLSHACHICSKTFSNRRGLSSHISDTHSELFSCDLCEKTGMSRQAYSHHKRRNHN